MVKKLQKGEDKSSADSSGAMSGGPQLAGTVKDSAQQIWLAGLGAFAKAQEEGGKVFEALVKEGMTLQRKTQSAAEGKISEATNRMASMATDISSKASGQWGKLEDIFEERVSRALSKLGVPSSKDIDALIARIDQLDRNVAKLGAGRSGAAKTTAVETSARPTAKSPARKRAAKKSA